MKRIYLSAAVMSVLLIAYQAYAQWFDAITALEEPPREAVMPVAGERPEQQPQFRQGVEAVLPDLDWVKHANYSFERKDSVYIYADNANQIDDGEEGANRVELSPFAMIISDPDRPEADPYVIRCESARIRFENPFRLELQAPSPGRIVGATLDGAVAITGPDGLEIYGQNFVFSEEAAHLYSYYPVAFAFGPDRRGNGRQRGSAQQLDIQLLASHDGILGRDGPRIGGLARITLRHDVRLNLTYKGEDGRFADATISSRGVFEYDVAGHIGTFEDDVVVRRPTSAPGQPPQFDELRCDWLALQFEPAPVDPNGPALADETAGDDDEAVRPASGSSVDDDERRHPFADLRFRQLRAHGNRAVLRSDENRLHAEMQELRYDAVERRVLLVDAEAVRLQHDATELMSPDVEVVHDAGGEVVSLDCSGAGRLEQYPADGGPALYRVFWDQHLGYGPDPAGNLWLIQVDGGARVIQTGEMGIQADQLALWVEPDSVQQFAERRPGNDVDLAPRPLPLKYAQATGHVQMASPDFRIETELLQATISPADPQAPANRAAAEAHLTEDETKPETGDDDKPREVWTLRAGAVQVQIVHDPLTDHSDVAEATAVGGVQITGEPGDGSPEEDAVSIAGEELHLDTRGGTGELLTLTGTPAYIQRKELHLEARDIVFDRRENTAQVEGRGMLRLPVSTDLNGKRLEEPVPLDVHWQEQMRFDGREAQFFGNVVLKLNDGRVNESRLYCEDLNVVLNRTVSFTEPPPSSSREAEESEPLQFTRVTCRDGVRTELYEWEGTRLSGIRIAELAEFTLEHDTGVLEGLGPGVISSWTRGAGRRISIAPDASAEANQPAESDREEWEYTQVHFSRDMTGNARQRSVELHGRVRAIYAPVQHPREVFTRDELSGDSPNAANAVWLGCDQLAVSLHPWEQRDEEDYTVFGATGHCELEGQLFRAVADLISFDQSKELFTLKSLGDGKASIYYQRNPGEHPQRLPAQIIQFIPSKQRISLQGASGFQGAP